MNLDAIPAELRERPRWVCWRYEQRKEKRTKVPYGPDGRRASVTQPSDWVSYDDALAALSNGHNFNGIGFVLVEGEGLVAFDFDKCLDAKTGGITDAKIADAVKRLASRTEITPSGVGLRVLVRAKLTGKGNRRGNIEMYDRERYVTLTGDLFPGSTATIVERQDVVDQLQRELIPQRRAAAAKAATANPLPGTPDERLKQALQDHAEAAKLYREGWKKGNETYASASDADLALARVLVCYGSDEEVDSWFRASKLSREKWNRPDYPERTITKARELARNDRRLSDQGNGQLFVEQNRGRVFNSQDRNKWLIFDGRRFLPEKTREAERLWKSTVKTLYAEAASATDPDRRKTLYAHALRSDSARAMQNALVCARSEKSIAIEEKEFDRDPFSLNVENGTLNLKTGKLRPHSPEDRITKLAPVAYDAKAKCPSFDKDLFRFLKGDREMVRFVWTVMGYCLTGVVSERVWFLIIGPTGSFKTTFLKVMHALLGDYALVAQPEILLASRYANNTGPTEHLARLRGARFVSSSETDEGRYLAIAQTKLLTGGDRIAARFLHENSIEIDPTWKIALATNKAPVVRDPDDATWRRLVRIPFDVQIPEADQDRFYFEKVLKPELPGILAGAVLGCRRWLDDGRLVLPDAIQEARSAYRHEQDFFARWLDERTARAEGVETEHKDLWASFEGWYRQEEGSEKDKLPLTKKAFGLRLEALGFTKRVSNGKTYRLNIVLSHVEGSI